MDQSLFKFDLIAEDPTTHARAGVLHTPHGDIETPIFMPVGTKQTSRVFLPRPSSSSAPDRACQYLPPVHASRRGHHRRAGRPTQVYELARPHPHRFGRFPGLQPQRRVKLTDEGVRFIVNDYDGRHVFWTPEDNMEIA